MAADYLLTTTDDVTFAPELYERVECVTSPTVNVTLLVRFGMPERLMLQAPLASVVQLPEPVAPLLQFPFTVAFERSRPDRCES
jgi:hypothetical protein